jgi:hypothetical protein
MTCEHTLENQVYERCVCRDLGALRALRQVFNPYAWCYNWSFSGRVGSDLGRVRKNLIISD